MSFDTLLGNGQLKENLTHSIQSGHISHFYLLSGPEGSGKHTLARLLAAAILCRETAKPCLRCKACRKVLEGNHPDFITVDDPEKKNVPVDLIRQARADMFIQPNESDRKIFLFPRAQDMRTEAQNALLKVLEEPPEYGVFILLTDNPEKLLPTVRSRCTELALRPLDEGTLTRALRQKYPQATAQDLSAAMARSGGFLGQAEKLLAEGAALPQNTADFAAAFGGRDALALTRLLTPMEKWKRDQLIPALESWTQLLGEALAYRNGLPALSDITRNLSTQRSPAELMDAITALKKALEYAQGNVSPGAICGWLVWELRS